MVHVGPFDRTSGDQVDTVGPVHLADLLGRDQLAAVTVDHIEEAVLRRLHQDIARLAIDGDRRERDLLRAIVIPAVIGIDLIMPDVLAGIGVQRDDRGGIEVVTAARAANI